MVERPEGVQAQEGEIRLSGDVGEVRVVVHIVRKRMPVWVHDAMFVKELWYEE